MKMKADEVMYLENSTPPLQTEPFFSTLVPQVSYVCWNWHNLIKFEMRALVCSFESCNLSSVGHGGVLVAFL
jgi:hypothetical protein